MDGKRTVMRTIVTGATVLGASALLVACSAAGGGDPSPQGSAFAVAPPAIGSPKPVQGTDVPALPLDSYTGLAEDPTDQQAQELLTRACMKAHGFSYTMQAPMSSAALAADAARTAPYGVASLSYAEKYGYGVGVPPAGHHFVDVKVGSQHSPAYNLALTGAADADPSTIAQEDNSCQGKAEQELSPVTKASAADATLVGQLIDDSLNFTEADSRVQAAERAWSQCMAGQGFRYQTPEAAHDAAWPPKPNSAEKATAVADVKCKQQVNLVGIWHAVEVGYQKELITQHAATLAAVRGQLAAERAKAEQVVAQLGGKQ